MITLKHNDRVKQVKGPSRSGDDRGNDGRKSGKREACHMTDSGADATVRWWITQECTRSKSTFSSRCVGIVRCGEGGV